MTLCGATVSKRRLPVNFDENNLELFKQALEELIPETQLLALNNVRVSADGILFRRLKILPESFAFPFIKDQWRRRSVLKFFVINYVLRRSRKVERDVLWIVDDWSAGYFHWLTDALSRLYVMRDRLNDFVLLLPWDYENREFVASSLRAFGVKMVEFARRDEVLSCRRLFMPTHTAPSGHYNEEIIRGVRNLLLQTYGEANRHESASRIYISRGRAHMRKIVNEQAVIDLLRQEGFQIVRAEDLSFEQQVLLFSGARYLISNHGAGLTNMLFMPEGASVFELRHQSDAVNNCYFTLATPLGLNYFYQTGEPVDITQDPHDADLLVDENQFKHNLQLFLRS
jgi:capsular polysaccharide biosynthesis protein